MTIARKTKPRRAALRWLAHPYWIGIGVLVTAALGIATMVIMLRG